MKRLLLKIASVLYGFGLRVRHLMFDWNIMSGVAFDIPVICVGNITAGGTGKTPAVEFLVRHLSKRFTVAVLSRGYGRENVGRYIEVSADDHYSQVGDEPLQIKRKYPAALVVVCADRVAAINRIRAEHPEVEMIIMDDGFQHRRVLPWINIVTVDSTRPVSRDSLLPLGTLRDTPDTLHRAHYFIATKCPESMKPIDKRILHDDLVTKPSQSIYYACSVSSAARPLFPSDAAERMLPLRCKVIAMSGLGNNKYFFDSLAHRYEVVETLAFKDHHPYNMDDLDRMTAALDRNPEAMIVMTEKDAVKLFNSSRIPVPVRRRMYYESVEMELLDDLPSAFIDKLCNDIKRLKDESYIRGC